MQIDEIIKLIETVSKNDVDSLNYATDSEKIVIKKNKKKFVTGEIQSAPVLQSVSFEAVSEKENTKVSGHTVTSPLVGTFYSAPSPDAPSFVNVGDRVKKGQVIGIIEAMKLMNELESDFDGVIKEILVKDEDVVEFGQPLFILE
ncbi:acetyl-CoA carboxylase biotin carboxyl carrier protein [Lachnoanaerobaculum sp. Marseille-Q4761]|jgi:acetyl-coA carboxylase, biotin carboxyl carrier protein|uniref:acetyl-CoA carboxylase biotin carboxyl carrier protein n=1 Tax=Lachnoanaerobaculum sp. Marseille-Q4761 TaxID=2819511 RepID=UPI001AA1157E|nr:acetyl-CoA carboxylase biotin carboxyl carrier protein [Lachnoanaerobaculum sp. Marseille-Q4761]MBO1870529.1 acetyl-CoA carboxylase biotin carboxyl carrier protein [Lachnoanaerobaculum sp. Marseille-Q4761]